MLDRRRAEGLLFLAGFALCIPAANWLIGNVGTKCVPNGPCLMPVGFGIMAPTGVAFLLAEMADLAVYTPLQRRGLVTAVVASSFVGLVIDSIVFLYLAFGSLDYLLGQVVGKSWMVLLSIPFILWLRRRDERLGLEPA
jgi:hypothetical protein